MSQSHSFDIRLAAKYGIEEAILIHHFQHWIRINTRSRRNLKEVEFNGDKIKRYFTYQSRKEIQLHFPYWNHEQVRHLCEKLVERGILISKNLNKSPIDKTLWYAFVDPDEFDLTEGQVDQYYENSNNVYEREKSLSNGKIPTPIPDTISSYSLKKKKEVYKIPPASPSISAEAESLTDFFLSKIKERNPEFKDPNRNKWNQEMDCLLRLDKRDLEKTKTLIAWGSEHKYWKVACLSPSKLRKDYDSMMMQMLADSENQIVRMNRDYAVFMQEKYPKQLKSLSFDAKYAKNVAKAKEIPFNLNHDSFKAAFKALFDGD